MRLERLDALRGLAIVWMAAYHFGFDLNHFGLLQPRQSPNTDPAWVAHRTAILSLFLFCAGAGQAFARGGGLGLIADCAMFNQFRPVSLATPAGGVGGDD